MNNKFETILSSIEKALQHSLPEKSSQDWIKTAFRELNPCVTDEHLLNLIKPCKSLIDLGGKRWRPILMALSSEMCREAGKNAPVSIEQTYSLTPLVEFVHTASLIHDDIEDSADTRRGKPAAHITYGLDTALNAGAWLYFLAPTVINELNAPVEFRNALYELYTEELRRLHLGQAMDIYWHRTPSLFPSIDEYIQMVHCKTGTLACLAVRAGFMCGGATAEESVKAGKTAACLGEGFQILDDVQNLTTGNPGKKRGDDIVEGKKSLPVLMHIQENPSDAEKISALFEQASKEGIDSPAVEKCIELLQSKGAVKKAAERGKAVIQKNLEELTGMIPGAANTESAGLIWELFTGMINKFQDIK